MTRSSLPQINGKVKARITVAADADQEAVKAVALEAVQDAVAQGPEEGRCGARSPGEHRSEIKRLHCAETTRRMLRVVLFSGLGFGGSVAPFRRNACRGVSAFAIVCFL